MGRLPEACVEGKKQATEQPVQMKSLTKNTHNIKTVSEGKHMEKVGAWSGQTPCCWDVVGQGQQDIVGAASRGNALQGPLEVIPVPCVGTAVADPLLGSW